jgi:hypothetical protein
MMHEPEKSDSVVVAVKPTNKTERSVAELVEPRTGTKGNANQQSTRRAQDRESVSQALERVRFAARREKKVKFTSLLHHVDHEMLRTSFYALKRDAAPGVDGMTWETYEQGLDHRIETLHKGPIRRVPGAAVPPELYSEGRRHEAPARGHCPGRQDCPKSGGGSAERDLRGGFPRVLVRVSTGAQPTRYAGCTLCRDQQQESEFHTGRRYSIVLHGSFPGMSGPLPGTPYRRQAHPPAHPEMVAGRAP